MSSPLQVVPSHAEIIDRFGELHRLIDQHAPIVEEEKRLHQEIESWYANLPPETPTVAHGKLYAIQIGPRQNERTITNPLKAFELLRKQLGLEAVLALITIPLGAAVDKFIPKSKHKLFITEERSGYRRFVAVPKQPADAPKRA
jgi:hypothetical protein